MLRLPTGFELILGVLQGPGQGFAHLGNGFHFLLKGDKNSNISRFHDVFCPSYFYLEEVVLRVILNQVGVDPALPVGQAVSGDVQGVLRGLDGKLEAPDLRLQQLILA